MTTASPRPAQSGAVLTAYLQLSVVALLWGSNLVVAKALLSDWAPFQFSGIRIALGSLLLAAVATARGQRWRLGRAWLWLIAAGALGIGLNNAFLYGGLRFTSAAHGALIMALAPIGTAVALRLAGVERMTRGRTLAVLVAVLGAAVVIMPASGLAGLAHPNTGDLAIFGAMVTQSASYIFLRRGLETVDAISATAITLGTGALVLLPGALLEKGPSAAAFAPWAMGLFIGSALFSMCLGMLWWNAGVAVLGANRTVIFNDVVPAVTLVLGALFLHAPVTPQDIVGFAVIAAAIAATVLPERPAAVVPPVDAAPAAD